MRADKAMGRLMGILEGEKISVYGSCRPETTVVRDAAGVLHAQITEVIVELNITAAPHVVEDLLNRIASGLVDDGGEES